MSKFPPIKYESEGCRLEIFGVLLEADSPQKAISRYQNGETAFWNTWRGSFFGVLYDEKNGISLLFNDHIGSKMLFYTQTEKGLVWDTNLYALAHSIGAKTDNENYLWQMLIYGYSPIGETVFKQICRLQAGEYIYARGKKIEKRIYHRFDNTPNNLSIEENIERIDTAFRKAIERVIRRNEESGYTHYIALSAGLDSRMVNRVAHEITKTPIHNITYSQTGFYDEKTPKELAEYWHNEMHFTPLDGGECLMNLDEVSRITSGLLHYSGASETLYGLPEEAKKNAGIFLTGTVGDYIGGTDYTKPQNDIPYHRGEEAILHGYDSLLRQVLPADFEQLYSDREIFCYYVKSFNCVNLGSPLIQQAFGESYSPFCDVDFLEVMLSTPIQQRWNYNLYDKWIITKYPDMARWKHNGIYTIGHRPKRISLFGRAIILSDVPKRMVWFILKKLHIHDFYKQTEGKSMTPEDTWFTQNEALRLWADKYMETNMALLNDFPAVQQKAKQFSQGNATERMQVLSLLACLRQTL
jgi:asparagine synthase (glutamine-hydrolysing)